MSDILYIAVHVYNMLVAYDSHVHLLFDSDAKEVYLCSPIYPKYISKLGS